MQRFPQGHVTSGKRKPESVWLSTTYVLMFIRRVRKNMKKTKHRNNVLNEWLNTQKSYYNDLNTALSLIKKPMREKQIISQQQSQVLFSEFDGMSKLSKMMYEMLEDIKKIKNPNKVKIGNDLLSFAPGYKIYSIFFVNHSESEELLATLSRNHPHQMKQIEAHMQQSLRKTQPKKENMTIKDCLEQPLYRLFKYVLLLKEYLKKLPRHHQDYEPLTRAMERFHDINNENNEKMIQLEERKKKIKLQKLFGKTLDETRTFISEMQADTIYFQGKLYILSNLVIVTKMQSMFGSSREEKHASIELDQFSYVSNQEDLKYFHHILILIGSFECIHLLFADAGSRMEVYKCIQKVLRDLRYKAYERRKLEEVQHKKQANKITFTLQNNVNEMFKFEPELRSEVIGVEVRPLGKLSNDTVYVTRFMIPYYYEDEVTFLFDEGLPLPHENRASFQRTSENLKTLKHNSIKRFNSLPFGLDFDNQLMDFDRSGDSFLCINQRVELHFSQLQQIYGQVIKMCPNYNIPNIDPITKDVNIYSQGKKKTKSFEMRKFFIEQFFNTIMRIEAIMHNPIWLIKQLRIHEDVWEYTVQRNQAIKKGQKEANYTYKHCQTCLKARISSIEEYEHYRSYYNSTKSHRANKSKQKYCMNFYNLIRNRMLSFPYISFNNLERILMFYNNLQGRIDYAYLQHRNMDKVIKVVNVYRLSLEDECVKVEIDRSSAVAEIIDQIGKMYNIPHAFDYGIAAMYNGKLRVLDRDEFLSDVVVNTGIKYEEIQLKDNKSVSDNKGFFSTLKDMFSSSSDNRLYFLKVVHLHRSLELKSFTKYPEKREIEVQKIFWSIRHGAIKLREDDLVEVLALYYCLKQLDRIQHYTRQKLSFKRLEMLLPPEQLSLLSGNKFLQRVSLSIEHEKNRISKQIFDKASLYAKIVSLLTQKQEYYTYYMDVQVRDLPQEILREGESPPKQCLIGINYNEFLVTKSTTSKKVIFRTLIDDIEFYTSVFSIFITYENEISLRFDSKLVRHFGQLLKLYQIVKKKFPQHH